MDAIDAGGDSLRERKKQHTYLAAAKAAVKLVSERGIRAVRVDDICERAGISRSTFFRYFDSKESCLIAGLHHGRLKAVLAALQARPAAEDAFTALCNAFLDITADWRDHRQMARLEMRIRAENPAVRAHSDAEYIAWEEALARALEPRCAKAAGEAAGQVADSVRLLGPRLVAGIVLCAVRLATEQWVRQGAACSPAEMYAQAFGAVRTVIAAGS
ncbi:MULTISPECIES: TetR family transcriptional regulator [Thermomonospora]|uniref:Transcriptional regulator, TetR family n=1 Tax=Thermomonospora curvata (strain ATCC 19995 / DSM 43183 / JCM 3096 / KCTC 9072 / NBRC 15933 / NCIMB 10081 / Henssen B9) TaxID=471852 RepID=D1A2Y7_THECD|nr:MULTISPECIES: TetR family transcriptional regulator [Thermomonospora]ACY97935.1 transcriptional regulator, TetR family [Thermomonospora curvata DSM 43183]PKK14214.1 MAG: TetR family transcriptional regulator [Thermomonospora sp. CIF 1]